MKIKWNWKHAFFILLTVNLLTIVWGIYLFFIPDEGQPVQNKQLEIGEPSIQMTASFHEINQIINYYIEKENKSPINYSVHINDHVEFRGTLTVFSQQVELFMKFEPKLLENGDLVLTEPTIELGRLTLPAKYVMNMLKKSYEFPKGVEIFPNEEMVYISFSQLPLKSNIKIQVNELDFVNDQIIFTIHFER